MIKVCCLLGLVGLGEPLVSLVHREEKKILVRRYTTEAPQQGQDSYVQGLAGSAEFLDALKEESGLVVIKFYAPWCRACRGLEPKYKRLSLEYFKKGGVSFYEMSHKDLAANEPDFLQEREVNVLPLIQFYHEGERVESFPCGPRKIEVLREKLEVWHTKLHSAASSSLPAAAAPPAAIPQTEPIVVSTNKADTKVLAGQELDAILAALKSAPLFAEIDEVALRAVVREGRIAHYDAGDPLIVEGEMGRRFFVLLDGECDVYKEEIKPRLTGFSPSAQSAYGARTNTLTPGAYFGERALVENAPRVVSIVAATDVTALAIERQALESAGVDLTGVVEDHFRWGYELTPDPDDTTPLEKLSSSSSLDTKEKKSSQRVFESLSVMQRLRLVRSCVRAFEQAAMRNPTFGDEKEAQYRRDLVQQLTYQQRLEFEQTFALLDKNNDGKIQVEELRSLMDAFGKHHYQESDLADMLNKANPDIDGNYFLSKEDFLALMAQAEFSAMFLETFKLLDPSGLGFLEAEQLWRVLDTLLGPEARLASLELDGAEDNSGSLTNFQLNYRHLASQFGLDDGHIDYAAFVKILLSSSGSSVLSTGTLRPPTQAPESTQPPPSSNKPLISSDSSPATITSPSTFDARRSRHRSSS